MSQRIHSCINNTNLDTIQCDAYATRLVTKDKRTMPTKSIHTKTTRENFGANRAPGAPAGSSSFPPRQTTQASKQESIVRKELYTENADMVEVTVKTHKSKDRARLNSHGQGADKDPWGKILKTQVSNENISSFTNFDPLRTIHFLAKELQCKLQHALPDDSGVQQMVSEMNQALSRVPTEIMSPYRGANSPRERCDMRPTKLSNPCKEALKQTVSDNTCQTPRTLYVQPEQLTQHLEASSEKIEKACKQMELLCSKLKTEKEELEQLLVTERGSVQILNRQIAEEKTKFSSANALVQTLQSRNEELQTENRKLQIQLESQQGPSAQELRTFIQQLQAQKAEAEEESMLLKQQLTLANMETEKYEAILQARDSQVKEIRNEMTQLQEVVNEQLMELQNNPYSSDVSSGVTTATGVSVVPSTKTIELRGHDSIGNKPAHRARKDTDDTSTNSEDFAGKQKLLNHSKRPNLQPVETIYDSRERKFLRHPEGTTMASQVRDKIAEIRKQALSYPGIKLNIV